MHARIHSKLFSGKFSNFCVAVGSLLLLILIIFTVIRVMCEEIHSFILYLFVFHLFHHCLQQYCTLFCHHLLHLDGLVGSIFSIFCRPNIRLVFLTTRLGLREHPHNALYNEMNRRTTNCLPTTSHSKCNVRIKKVEMQ
jgi:hypothetical protein